MHRSRNKKIVWLTVGLVIVIIVVISLMANRRPDYVVKKTDRPFWGNPRWLKI
ncbi:MAG: hypothetical protein NTV81_01485 [Candidatus Komeilibacteria bacterium]|nr:hypothetical protein [Candidatus Komeilibacteria bacterium]